MKEPLFHISESITYKLLRREKGILYYEGGWWMSEATYFELEHDRFQREYNPRYNTDIIFAPRPNKETKEIELDRFLVPTALLDKEENI